MTKTNMYKVLVYISMNLIYIFTLCLVVLLLKHFCKTNFFIIIFIRDDLLLFGSFQLILFLYSNFYLIYNNNNNIINESR
jgi:hypothetical protein